MLCSSLALSKNKGPISMIKNFFIHLLDVNDFIICCSFIELVFVVFETKLAKLLFVSSRTRKSLYLRLYSFTILQTFQNVSNSCYLPNKVSFVEFEMQFRELKFGTSVTEIAYISVFNSYPYILLQKTSY